MLEPARLSAPAAVLLVMALGGSGAAHAQLNDPIPKPITTQGLRVEIQDVARLPDTRGRRPSNEDTAPNAWARTNFIRELPDGRRFVNDLRGVLYVLDRTNRPSAYLDVLPPSRSGSTGTWPPGW